jgi:predicted transcriptional regulator
VSEPLALTDLQIDLMRVLWRLGEASVIDVHRALAEIRDLAQPTIATLLSRLEKKGAVDHRTVGRQFVYRPLVSEAEVRRSMLAQIADRLFGGDVPTLIHQLLSERQISPKEIAAVKELLLQYESSQLEKRPERKSQSKTRKKGTSRP